MTAALAANIINLLVLLAPLIDGSSPLLGKVIDTLIGLIPLLVKEFQDLLPEVQNIIAEINSKDDLTSDQMTQLAKLDAQVDAAFDEAAKGAGV